MAYIKNPKAHFDFEIIETFEAGLVLSGHEVKAIRNGMGKLIGAHVVVRGGEAFLVGANINPFQVANTPKSYDSERSRKLLLSKKELAEIEQAVEKNRLTAIPLSLYKKGSKIKLEIAIARGKKKADKRQTIKERDTKRDIERTLKNQY
ncbi:SsrA-binding protein [bacterium]|nr:SsrA-binding protein [bacterium]